MTLAQAPTSLADDFPALAVNDECSLYPLLVEPFDKIKTLLGYFPFVAVLRIARRSVVAHLDVLFRDSEVLQIQTTLPSDLNLCFFVWEDAD